MIFAEAVIVFVGVAGNHHEVVERQLGPVLDHAGVNELVIPQGDLATIVRHTDASREVIKKLHVDGVIGGALITSGGQQAFRLVIYDGNGNMRSLGETPLAKNKLTSGDLEVLGINLADEVTSLQGAHPNAPDLPASRPMVAKPAPAPAPAPPAPPPARVAAMVPTRAPAPAPTRTPSHVLDDEDPLAGKSHTSKIVAAPPAAKTVTPVAPTAPADAPSEAAAPKQVADANAVSMDEIEALTGGGDGGGGGGGGSVDTVADPIPSSTLHLHIDAGMGMTGRVFAAPMAVTGYTSTPVSTVHFAAGVSPTERTSIDATAERTISMSTALDAGSANTTVSRWQIDTGYALVAHDHGLQLTANLGVGHRAFTIDATPSAGRTPDTEYSYVAIGAHVAQPLGSRLVVRGRLELEPVFGGNDQQMQMALGTSTRWGLDVGAAAELALVHHLTALAAFDYQRFAWSWDGAGARAAGGASDSYPSASVALRTDF